MSITGKHVSVDIFLKWFGVYFNIVISVFIFSHMVLESVEHKIESKNQHLASD